MDVRQTQYDQVVYKQQNRKERQRLELHDLNLRVQKVFLLQFDILIDFYSTGNNRKTNRFMHEL